jgi:hypothetical protein
MAGSLPPWLTAVYAEASAGPQSARRHRATPRLFYDAPLIGLVPSGAAPNYNPSSSPRPSLSTMGRAKTLGDPTSAQYPALLNGGALE